MSTLIPVLVIGQDDATFDTTQKFIPSNYNVSHCSSIISVIELCRETQPVIVLLDIDKTKDESQHIIDKIKETCDLSPSVLCLSDNNSPETRLSVYKYGGDDYLEKPISEDELKAKLDRLQAFHKQQRSIHANNQMATQTAMSAMIEASQYGGVLRFFNDMYQCGDIEQIKDRFFKLMVDFGLKTSIQFRTNKTITYDSTNKEPRPIELQVYDNMKEDGRLISFSSRLMVNATYVSFIVKNMPVHDEVITGRFQDMLAVIVEGIDSKLTDLQRLSLLRQTAEEVAASSQRLSDVMNKHEDNIVNAMNHVIGEIGASFDVLELTEEQENFFRKLTENILQSVEESFVYIGNEQDVLNCLWLSLRTVLSQK